MDEPVRCPACALSPPALFVMPRLHALVAVRSPIRYRWALSDGAARHGRRGRGGRRRPFRSNDVNHAPLVNTQSIVPDGFAAFAAAKEVYHGQTKPWSRQYS